MTHLEKAHAWLERIKMLSSSKTSIESQKVIEEHAEVLEWLIKEVEENK